MAKSDPQYWAFLEEMPETDAIKAIREYSCDGMSLLASLKAAPEISFGRCTIDFNSSRWDFTGITTKNILPSQLKISFGNTALDDALKLFLVCSIVWQSAKVQSLVPKTRNVGSLLGSSGIRFNDIVTLTVDDAAEILNRKRAEHAIRTTRTHAIHLASFLEFFDRMFYRLSERGLVASVEAYASRLEKLAEGEQGYPLIPAAYFDPLVGTCVAAMRDEGERIDSQITGAVLAVFSQTGIRSSHLLATKTNALDVSKGVAGKPDITYMKYGDTKASHVDDGEVKARTMINPIALEAYLWLEEACRPYREEIGVDTLVVYPNQKRRHCTCNTFLAKAKRFILHHHGTVPCIETQGEFPELSTDTVGGVLKGNTKHFCDETGLDPADTVVYPVIHSFRVNVATGLKEQGVDMHYIRMHMNQMNEDVTAGYIRSDRQVEEANSDLVYRSIFGDGAKLLGQHADEFMAKVTKTIDSLEDRTKMDIEDIVKAASELFPLRMKLLGICIRCGNVVPCPVSDGTDEILCAFGVCPNQCHLYFMANISLGMARTHMRLVEANLSGGKTKGARNELRKAQNIIRSTLLPELESLDEQVAAMGADEVLARFPALGEIIENRESIDMEVEEWLQMKL